MMKKEIEINELIEAYLAGTLSADEMKDVRNRMQEDEAFAGQVAVIRQLHEMISDSVYLDVKDALKKVHLRKMRASRNIRRITGFGSAGLIVGLAVLLLLTRNGGPDTIPLEDAAPLMETEITGPDAAVESASEATEPEVSPSTDKPRATAGKAQVTNAPELTAAGQSAALQGSDSAAGSSTADDFMMPQEDTAGRLPVEEHMAEAAVMPNESHATGDDDAGQVQDLMSISEKVQGETKAEATPDELASPDVASRGNDCRDVVIEALLITEASCNNEPTGRIQIDLQTISGGRAPYAFSLNGKTFSATSIFPALLPGSYPVYARDDAGCVSRLETVLIDTEDCSYEYAFAPGRGDVWIIPVRKESRGMLSIYSKEGILVYSTPVSGNEITEWRGQTVSGQGLDMGLYQFVIRYDDGTVFTGNVTLVR